MTNQYLQVADLKKTGQHTRGSVATLMRRRQSMCLQAAPIVTTVTGQQRKQCASVIAQCHFAQLTARPCPESIAAARCTASSHVFSSSFQPPHRLHHRMAYSDSTTLATLITIPHPIRSSSSRLVQRWLRGLSRTDFQSFSSSSRFRVHFKH